MGSGTEAHDEGESSSSESNPADPSGDSSLVRALSPRAGAAGGPPGACAGVTNAPAGVGGSPDECASCGAPALPGGTYTGPPRRVEASAGVFCDDAAAALPRVSDGFDPE